MKNKKIVITGAFGKIGFVAATILLEQGHSVILSDMNLNLKKYNALKIKFKNNVEFFKSNITKSSEIDKLIQFTIKKFMKIDILIHCAYPKNSKFTNFDKKINEIKGSLGDMEKTLRELQDTLNSLSSKKAEKEVSEENVLYLEDLKKEIIPAIQKKLMDNNREFREFVRTLMAEREVKSKISKELNNTEK